MASAQFGQRGRGGAGLSTPEKVSSEIQEVYKQLDEKSGQDPPKRDLRYKTETEPVKTKLFRADPKLLENKFVAKFGVMPAGLDLNDQESVTRLNARVEAERYVRYPDEIRALVLWNRAYMFRSSSRASFEESPAQEELFKLWADKCPPELRPAQRIIDFLTSEEGNRDVIRSRSSPSPSALARWQFTVYAPDAEAAQERAAAILQLLDCGLSRPMQRFALEQGKAALAEARQAESEVAAANKAIESERAKLAKPSEISDDILSQLKAQKIMVAIELSGLSARVKACDEMLVKPLPANTLASIGDMKVKAEIDRIGIKEKLDQINALIAEGDARQAASARLLTLTRAKQRAQSSLSSAQTTAAWYADIFALYAPFQLEGNQITISPIEWTN